MPFRVRPWTVEDKEQMLPLIIDLLRITVEQGAKMLPTERNALAFWQLGLMWAEKGDPSLVATTEEGTIAGYTVWGALPNPLGLDMKEKECTGCGTYVSPIFRQHGISKLLREAAMEIARKCGYAVIQGCVYVGNEPGIHSAAAVGFDVTAMLVERRL